MLNITVSGNTVAELRTDLETAARLLNFHVEPLTAKQEVRVNKVGQGRKAGSKTAAKTAVKKAVVKKSAVVEAVEAEIEPVEVGEPANQHIMDDFNKDLEEKGIATNTVDELDNLLSDVVPDEVVPQVSAKNPNYEDVAAAVTRTINALKAAGKDPVKVIGSVLTSFKVKKVGDLDKAHWSHFIQKIQSVI